MVTRGSQLQACLVTWVLISGLFSQNLVILVRSDSCLGDQKWFYTPDPHARTPPTYSHKSPPPHGSGGSYGTPLSPIHRTPSSSPPYCGKPPSGDGGEHHDPKAPAPPKGGNGKGGGYYHSPPSSSGGRRSNPPKKPPSSPPTFVPKLPPFTGTCDFWRTHPALIWSLFGWWGTLGAALGVESGNNIPRGIGISVGKMNLLQALSNRREDAVGELYREGTASLLNSMVSDRFPYSTKHVRDSFLEALSSNNAASAAIQAQLFKLANEGRLIKP